MNQLMSSPWAIEPAAFQEFLEAQRTRLTNPNAQAAPPSRAKTRGEYSLQGSVAVIPVEGVLMRRPDFFDRFLGAESTEDLQIDIASAIEDQAVKSILLDINSPGGAVDGSQELAEVVHRAAAQKPVVALANGLMASAAYWIGAAADTIWTSSGVSRLGAIGVITAHVDLSERERMLGIKVTDLYAGKFKAVGTSHAPLSAESREVIQDQLDRMYTAFVGDVAKYRGVPVSIVRDRMAEGRIFVGEQAVEAGLADGRASLGELVGRMNGGTLSRRRAGGPGAGAYTPPAHVAQLEEVDRLDRDDRTFEQRCKAKWDADANLRGEYGGDFRAYTAWERVVAEGRVHGQGGGNG